MPKLPTIEPKFEPYTIHQEGPKGEWERTVTLPATGKFVEESHYVTNKDWFPDGRKFPCSEKEYIDQHLNRSLQIYKRHDEHISFPQLYKSEWNKVWTPEEGGKFGQGSVGDIQVKELSPEMEIWFMTMMWRSDSKPSRGTKFLLSANNRHVVVVAGYETGPGDKKFIGGITREVHAWLRTDDDSDIEIRYLSEQEKIPIGPVELSRATELLAGDTDRLSVSPVKLSRTYYRADTHRSSVRRELSLSAETQPLWLRIAIKEIGVREYEGQTDNPRIVEYLNSTTLGSPDNLNDETLWCSAFVNWCVEQSGVKGTDSAWARDWLHWGQSMDNPIIGCIVVFSRGDGGHVGFYIDKTPSHIKVLGGNQNHEVNISSYPKSRLLGYRIK